MIHYVPLWKTMAEQNVTTYTLRFKHGMSHNSPVNAEPQSCYFYIARGPDFSDPLKYASANAYRDCTYIITSKK